MMRVTYSRSKRIEISDENVDIDSNTSYIMFDIKLLEDISIEKQGQKNVSTNILIRGPINKFNLLVKRHKQLPVNGILKTQGYISPQLEDKELKVLVKNPHNFNLKMKEGEIIGVIILSTYISL